MNCPDCGIEIGSLPCWRCEREALDHEWEFKSLIKEFSLVRGPPDTDAARESLEFALRCIQKRLTEERFQMTVPCDTEDLLRSKTWWYVPYRRIGCRGFIVNLNEGYVNWLGSGLRLRHCFWGHEHGIACDLVDFTFSPDTAAELAARLLPRFKHLLSNAGISDSRYDTGALGNTPPAALSNQFPTFRRHFVWSSIPVLFHAYENEALRFTCSLSAEPDKASQATNALPGS